MKIILSFLLMLVATTPQAGESAAQPPKPSACTEPGFHQFDFWIGTWEVSSQGTAAGHNTIMPFAGGCALLENWTGVDGGKGKSINLWRPAEQRWTQHWVGSDGSILDLSGGLVDGRMELAGPVRQTPKGPVMARITWTPVSENEVRQVWELSLDNGATWRSNFDGSYIRAGANLP